MHYLPSLSANSSLPEVVDALEQTDALTSLIIQHGGLAAKDASGINPLLVTCRHSVGGIPVEENYAEYHYHPMDIAMAVGRKGDIRQVIGGGLVNQQEQEKRLTLEEVIRRNDMRRYLEGGLKDDLFFPLQAESLLTSGRLFQGIYDTRADALRAMLLEEFREEVGDKAAAAVTIEERELSGSPKETHLASATFGPVDDGKIRSSVPEIKYDTILKRLKGLIIIIREHALNVMVPSLDEWKEQVVPTKELDGVEVLRVGDLYDRYAQATSGENLDDQLQSWRSFKGGKPRPSTIWYPLQLLKDMLRQE